MGRRSTGATRPRTTLAVPALLLTVVAGCGDGGGPPGEPVTAPATNTPTGTASASTPTTGTPATSTPTPADRPRGVPGSPTTVADDLDVPWSIAVLPDGGALVSLRDQARLLRVAPGGGVTRVAAPGPDGTVPDVEADGEGGLLGLALDPEDPTTVYAYSTAADGNRVTRWSLDGDRLTDPEVVIRGIPSATTHNGGRLAFGPDGYLYVSTGDAGDGSASQDPESLAGKILRITRDGAAPPGNPVAGSPVWSLGHRNVQGLGWTQDGTMYASEFGQSRLDELNRIEPGANYGWPQAEGSDGSGGFVDPVLTWPVSEASPSGLAVTADAVYLAALRGERLWRVPLGPEGAGAPEAYLQGGLGRLRDVTISPDGDSLWVLTNNTARGDAGPRDDLLVDVPLG